MHTYIPREKLHGLIPIRPCLSGFFSWNTGKRRTHTETGKYFMYDAHWSFGRETRGCRTCSSLLDLLSCTPSSSLLLRTSVASRPIVLYDLSLFSAGPFEAIFLHQRRGLRKPLDTVSGHRSVFSYGYSSGVLRISSCATAAVGEMQSVCNWLKACKRVQAQPNWVEACLEWIQQEEARNLSHKLFHILATV